MAVIVSNGNTSLATASGFYRCEAYNLALQSSTGLSLSNTTARALSVTFANAGNCQGVIISLFTSVSTVSTMRGVTARLQETKSTCTITIASPGVVTNTAHGLAADTPISFTTTGALPTGITANLIYYVSATGLTADTFQFSTTIGGASVNTSGTQSGTHTLWATRASKALTGNEICNSVARPMGGWIIPFEFGTPYAVDTTASKWRFHFIGDTTGTNNWTINTSDATNMFYVTWCDTAVSHTNGDVLIVKNTVTIDKTATLTGSTSNNTGDTTGAVAVILCRNTTPTVANVANLVWENPPAASYTLTINGVITVSSHSGFRAGTSAARISIANKGILDFVTPSSGSLFGFKSSKANGTSPNDAPKGSLFFYGEVPTYRYTTLNGDAATAQAVITTTDTTGWANGDIVYVGKQDTIAQGDVTQRTISIIAGTSITLSSNLATATRKSGATVMRMNGYGFQIKGPTALATSLSAVTGLSNFVVSGVQVTDHIINTATNTANNNYDDAANRSQQLIEDSSVEATSTSVTRFSNQVMLPHDGIAFQRLVLFRVGLYGTCNGGTIVTGMGPGDVTVDDIRVLSAAASSGTDTNSKIVAYTISDISLENTGTNGGWIINGAKNTTMTNCSFWGSGGALANSTAALMFGTTINARLSGNSFNRGTLGILFLAVPQQGIIDINSSFGSLAANTTDVDFLPGSFTDYELRSPTGAVNIGTTNLTQTINGTQFKVPDYNDTTNDDRVWLTYGRFQRTGTGLTDTTVRTSPGFAMRFEPVDDGTGTFPLEWSQVVPTGNIQNLSMTISVWVYINNTAYDAGTYTMPTMTIDYDNGTLVSAVATATFGSWQQLAITFTPVTTYGQVTLTISGATTATGSNAYFYIDDFNVAYPAGVSLNLGSLDIWAGALPVTPTIATFPSLGTAERIADIILRRTTANVEASSDGDAVSLKSLYGMIAQGVHNTQVSGATLTVTKSNDTTVLGTRTVTTSAIAEPIIGIDSD